MVQQAVPVVLHDWKHGSAEEAKKEILEALGDLSKIEIFGAQVLIVPYERPKVKKLAGGKELHFTSADTSDDKWQGKVGLIVKIGPTAFKTTQEAHFGGRLPEVGEWIFHDVKACFMLHVRGDGGKGGREGRLVYAADIFGRLQDLTPVV